MDIGIYHPIIVHFAIALLVVGVVFRLLSLTGRVKWTGAAAAALLIVGALGAFTAVESGSDAHGPAERIPGARQVVEEHEEWGERSRNLFLAIAVLEVAVLLMPRHRHRGKLLCVSALAGLVGLFVLYETGEHGGELVYSYAGGVGTRSGESEDIERLLLAGLYHQAAADRRAGDPEAAARLIDEMVRRWPADREVQMLYVQSLIEDRSDGQGALEVLARVPVLDDNRRLRYRHGLMTAAAQEVLGDVGAARRTLVALREVFPDSGTIRERLEDLPEARE